MKITIKMLHEKLTDPRFDNRAAGICIADARDVKLCQNTVIQFTREQAIPELKETQKRLNFF